MKFSVCQEVTFLFDSNLFITFADRQPVRNVIFLKKNFLFLALKHYGSVGTHTSAHYDRTATSTATSAASAAAYMSEAVFK